MNSRLEEIRTELYEEIDKHLKDIWIKKGGKKEDTEFSLDFEGEDFRFFAKEYNTYDEESVGCDHSLTQIIVDGEDTVLVGTRGDDCEEWELSDLSTDDLAELADFLADK